MKWTGTVSVKTPLNVIPVLPYSRNKIGIISQDFPKNSRFRHILNLGFRISKRAPDVIFDQNRRNDGACGGAGFEIRNRDIY